MTNRIEFESNSEPEVLLYQTNPTTPPLFSCVRRPETTCKRVHVGTIINLRYLRCNFLTAMVILIVKNVNILKNQLAVTIKKFPQDSIALNASLQIKVVLG